MTIIELSAHRTVNVKSESIQADTPPEGAPFPEAPAVLEWERGFSSFFEERHKLAIHDSGAVAVLAAATGWERFVLVGCYDVKRTMRVPDREALPEYREVTLRQYMALWCVGEVAGEVKDRIFFIDDTHTAGLDEPQLAAVGLPAMERRLKNDFHSGTFGQVPHGARRALVHTPYESPQPMVEADFSHVA